MKGLASPRINCLILGFIYLEGQGVSPSITPFGYTKYAITKTFFCQLKNGIVKIVFLCVKWSQME